MLLQRKRNDWLNDFFWIGKRSERTPDGVLALLGMETMVAPSE